MFKGAGAGTRLTKERRLNVAAPHFVRDTLGVMFLFCDEEFILFLSGRRHEDASDTIFPSSGLCPPLSPSDGERGRDEEQFTVGRRPLAAPPKCKPDLALDRGSGRHRDKRWQHGTRIRPSDSHRTAGCE